MSVEDTEQAILDWVNTFPLESSCLSLIDLCDGVIITAMLAEISPTYFDKANNLPGDQGSNWALCSSNLKKLLRMLEDYYKNVLRKDIDMTNIDVTAIARDHNPDSLFNLLELVVGCAVLSENKAHFIQNIFSLDHASQTVLKGMVERVMRRAITIPVDDSIDTSKQLAEEDVSEGISEELIRAREMVNYLQEERAQLQAAAIDSVSKLESYQIEISNLKAQVAHMQEERSVDGNRAMTVASVSASLQTELVEAKRDSDLKALEIESLRSEIQTLQDRLAVTAEIKARLELDAQQMADELDLARDKASQLIKAESTIEKYKKRVEDMSHLKKQNSELESKMDTYLDKIAELESSNRNMSTLNRMVEQYKDKAVELEREKFEAISEVQMKSDEIKRLTMELEEVSEARNFLQEELIGVRGELETVREQHAEGGAQGGLGMFESVASLKEQLKQQEAALRIARESGGSADLALLQAELDDTKRIRKEREEMLMTTRRQLAETQQEAHRNAKALNEALEHAATVGSGGSGLSKEQVKEFEQQLSMRANTIKQMEARIGEKESDINRLEQEKGKLENYAKKTLSTFKDKYMAALNSMKSEKRVLEDKIQMLQAKIERDQETHRREERLLLSSMYELGVRLMDRNIQMEMRDSSTIPTTFLAAQRAEQDRNTSGSLPLSSANANVIHGSAGKSMANTSAPVTPPNR